MTNVQRIGRPRSEAVLVGHCVGAEGDETPCGRPLASGRHYKAMGVWQNIGHMRCKACTKRQATKDRRKTKTVVRVERPSRYGVVDLSWQAGAACAGQDSSPFTSDLTGNKIPDEVTAAAWKFCAGCSIRKICASEADKHRDIGLRGGTFRVLKPLSRTGEASRYKKYDVLAGEGPDRPQTAGRAA